jgi:hypothetical protein
VVALHGVLYAASALFQRTAEAVLNERWCRIQLLLWDPAFPLAALENARLVAGASPATYRP